MTQRNTVVGARRAALAVAAAVLVALAMPGAASARDGVATVSGTVTEFGTPLPNTCVAWSTRFGSDEVSVQTDSDGRYSLAGVPANRPGVVRACGSETADDHTSSDQEYAPMYFPEAATRSTATEITLAPGEQRSIDFALRRGRSISAIVRGLKSSSGCEVVGGYSGYGFRQAALRPGPVPGTYVADLFGVIGNGSPWVHLQCDGGKWNGVGHLPGASESVPLYEHGRPENALSPVLVMDYDPVGPVITTSPAIGSIGWTGQPVTVSFTCTDAVTGVRYCPPPVTLGQGQTATVTAIDGVSNPTWLTIGPLPVDQTPPLVLVPGEQRAYRRDETLRLGCEVLDGESGLVWQVNQCPVWGTPASALEVGDHEFWVAGTDAVGNVAATIVRISIVK
jgi:hypothetical protein